MTLSRYRNNYGGVGFAILAVFTLIGVAVAAFMMYIGWYHNSQGEFHDDTGVYWGYWLFLGFSWFILITGIPYGIALAVFIRRIIRSRDTTSTPTI